VLFLLGDSDIGLSPHLIFARFDKLFGQSNIYLTREARQAAKKGLTDC